MNQSTEQRMFPSNPKIASGSPYFRKDEKLLEKNNRPMGILVYQVFERLISNQLSSHCMVS